VQLPKHRIYVNHVHNIQHTYFLGEFQRMSSSIKGMKAYNEVNVSMKSKAVQIVKGLFHIPIPLHVIRGAGQQGERGEGEGKCIHAAVKLESARILQWLT